MIGEAGAVRLKGCAPRSTLATAKAAEGPTACLHGILECLLIHAIGELKTTTGESLSALGLARWG